MEKAPKSKSTLALLQFCRGKKYLVIDPNKLIRPVLKKLMVNLKVQPFEVSSTDTIEVSEKLIKREKPDFVFSAQNIYDESYQRLLDAHLEACPNRNQAAFILISETESFANSVQVRDSEITCCMKPPFTLLNINEETYKTLFTKAKASKEKIALNNALEPLFRKDYKKARVTLEEVTRNFPDCADAKFYLGKLASTLEKQNKALENYEEALKIKENHFRSLNQALHISLAMKEKQKAYGFSEKLIQYFPFSPDQLSSFIRISVANGKYSDIFKYEELITKPEEMNPKQEQTLAAGLTLCSKYFHSVADLDNTRKALSLALKYSGINFQLLKNICLTYVKLKDFEAAKAIIKKLSSQVQVNEEFQIFEFEVVSHYEEDEFVVTEGLKNIRKGVKSTLIYSNVIKSSLAINRKRDLIEDLVFEAKRDFPNDALSFNLFLDQIPE